MRRLALLPNFVLGAMLFVGSLNCPAEPPADKRTGAQVPLKKFRTGNASDTSEKTETQSPTYRLAANDTVEITVFGEDDLNTTARIGKDGAVTMPLVGLVKIGGQSVREAAVTLEGRLRQYLVKPQVAVNILAYSKRRITILGQVNRPGTFDLPDEASIDLLEAIGMAGGYTRLANPSRITLKRMVKGRETLYKLDAKQMLDKEAGERVTVLPGDTIIVAERIF
jgi:polysaccharide export outer membrane protein